MAQVRTVQSFRGSTKNPKLECESCGVKIVKGDPYRHWTNHSMLDSRGEKHVRCMATKCDPRPSETDGNPKRKLLLRGQEDVHMALDDLLADCPGEPEIFLDRLREIVLLGLAGADECAALQASKARAGHTGSESSIAFKEKYIRDTCRNRIKKIDVPDAPAKPENPNPPGDEHRDYEMALETWRSGIVASVRSYADSIPDLMDAADKAERSSGAFLPRW
jgi:hypothetical protein